MYKGHYNVTVAKLLTHSAGDAFERQWALALKRQKLANVDTLAHHCGTSIERQLT